MKIYRKLFFSAFIMFIIGAMPILIVSGGQYLYMGDYNVQIVPFWEYINQNWKNGMPAIDYNSDLGMNYLASYSFYGLSSPYTLLSLIFPAKVLPYAMTFVNALKFAVAAVAAGIYCGQYVKKKDSVYLCGLLYAFSGQQLFNLVYHFSDAVSLFPLLLYSFDKLIHENKRLGFALMTAVCAFTNYFFFFSEVIFVVIYFIVKIISKQIKLSPKLFGIISFEAIIGTLCAMIIYLPTLACLNKNSRASHLIFDSNLLAYENEGTVWKIIQSAFFIPDSSGLGLVFDNRDLNLASISLYIPFFSVIGILAIAKKNKQSWYNILLYICAMFAVVPILNSVFSAFNSTYYARWFFMPLLIMTMMTGIYIDDIDQLEIKNELKLTTVIVCLFSAYSVYLCIKQSYSTEIKIRSFANIMVSVLALVFLYLYKYHSKGNSFNFKQLKQIVCVFCIIPFIIHSIITAFYADSGEFITNQINNVSNDNNDINLKSSEFFRTTQNSDCKTYLYGYPSIDLFHSLVTASSTNFWSLAGRYRESNGVFDETDFAARSLLSVKYDLYYNQPGVGGIEVEASDVDYKQFGYKLIDIQNKYLIYENENYIPMGFTFDYYIDESKIKKLNIKDINAKENKLIDNEKNQKLMLKAIMLDKQQISKYSDILEELPDDLKKDTSDETYAADCENRRKNAGYEFTADKNGFTSKINLQRDNLVFYSVAYDSGYTAYVDGKETEIEKVFGGLCAVKVPKGDHTVRFDYTVKGLKEGKIITLCALGAFVIYAVYVLTASRKKKNK